MNKKTVLPIAFISALLLSALAGNLHFGMAQSGVISILGSDTVWTKANSPFSLSGPVVVTVGVTLTIQAGATVNLNSYYITVNGTLRAIGSSVDPIHFNGGSITFTEYSNAWNVLTGSGCVIENAVLSATSLYAGSVKITNNSINAAVSGGSSVIVNNVITGSVTGGSIVSNNIITGTVSAGSLVSNNTIVGEVSAGGSSVVSNNTITGGGVSCTGNSQVTGNIISGCSSGVMVSSQFFASGGSPVIEKNLISNNTDGIDISILIRGWVGTNIPIIQNNTITKNSVGIKFSYVNQEPRRGYPLPTIIYNNILNNSDYNFRLDTSEVNPNATFNWWGTTDVQSINLTIRDFKYDLSLGTVNFVPFSSSPNLAAPATTSFSPNPTITPSPTQSPPRRQTKTTISVPPRPIPLGTTATITGYVLDNLTEVPGVAIPVTGTAIDPNGNSMAIGTVLTDGYSGIYKFIWTPPIEGSYTIMVTFAGTQYLNSSYATADLTVGPATSTPTSTFTPNQSSSSPSSPNTSSTPLPSEQPTPSLLPSSSENSVTMKDQSTAQAAPQMATYGVVIAMIIVIAVVVGLMLRMGVFRRINSMKENHTPETEQSGES